MEMWNKIFQGKYSHYIFIGLLFLVLAIAFFDMAFKGYAPPASDSQQWRASAQAILEYNSEHKDQALWNPNVFSGMPSYLISFGAKYPFINEIKNITNKVINWRVLLLFMAGVGVYILMIYLGFEPIVALITALAFALSTHFQGLIEIGHNTKVKAIIYIPWIMWALLLLKNKKNILSLALLGIAIIGQLRENHAQISYYTFLMIGIYWISYLVYSVKDKNITEFLKFTGLLLIVFILSFMAVSQPYLSIYEYSQYTIRGGSEGLDTAYATSWSFHPLEMLTFLAPNFFGGVSPDYWGWMQFTQTSMYMGGFIFLLALLAIFAYFKKNRLVRTFTIVSIVSLLLAFGKYFKILSDFMLKYFPFYNKFRVPAMTLVLLQFAVVVLAGYGIKYILSNRQNMQKLLRSCFIAIAVLFVIFLLLQGSLQKLDFVKDAEQSEIVNQYVQYYGQSRGYNYASRHLQELSLQRFQLLRSDSLRFFLIAALLLAIVWLFNSTKISKYVFLTLLLVLSTADLMQVDKRFLQDLKPQQQLMSFNKNKIDRYLEKDDEIFRIYPFGQQFGQNRWAYYHQSLGGYHGAKLKRYQQVIEKCLYTRIDGRLPINWNVVNMLNAKYIVYNGQIPSDKLEWAAYDRQNGLTLYKNKTYLPRAWFVKNLEVIKQEDEVLKRLNSSEFDPGETAIVEEIVGNVQTPEETEVKLQQFGLHELTFKVKTDKNSFLTISEIYYPAGWKAYIDGEQIPIYPTNYILRGVVVPTGEHTLKLQFEPEVYNLSLKLSLIGILSVIILLIVGIYWRYRKR